MSKNKKRKNSNYKTTNKAQDAVKNTSSMPKWFTPVLIGLIVVIAIALGVIALTNPGGTLNNDDISQGGNNITRMEKYLEQKYDMDFVYEGDTSGFISLFTCLETEDTIAGIESQNLIDYYAVDPNAYTEKYADNGYGILMADHIKKYYESNTTVDLGNHNIVLYFNTIAYPSFVSPDKNYAYHIEHYADAFRPTVAILTDKDLTEEECKQIESEYAKLGHSIYLRIAKYEADAQDLPIDIILNNMPKNGLYRANINIELPEGEG